MNEGNKHAEVTAESLKRRATRHRECAREHRKLGKDKSIVEFKRIAHLGAALANTDTAAILRDEAEEILSHP